MAIIKKGDIVEKGALDQYTKDVEKATAATKKLQDQVREVSKEGTGANAQKHIQLTEKLTTSTKKLKNAFTAEERVKQQILRANAKLAESRSKAAKDLALVRQKTLQANKALRDQAKATLGVRKGISSLAKQMFAGIGIIAGFRALGRVFSDALKTYREFTKESSRLAAILGKNKKEIKDLTKQAKDLGSTTAFTASQVVQLQIELAKLGFSLKEIEASTPGILDLAAATGTELANAAELAGATLRIFNLDASEMQRVTDVLALSTTKSSLSMEKLAVIMPVVGKTAQIAGVSLERTAALAGTLTDRGIEASTAGTSLRNIFLKLAKDGRTWDDAMQEVNSSTDKLKTAVTVFGVRASTAGIIISETAEETDKLTVALNDANGAAKEMAKTMLDNLSGDITKATSAWEGFILSVIKGDGIISKSLRGITSWFTRLLGELTQLNDGSSLALIQMKNVQKFEERLEKFRERNAKIVQDITETEEKRVKVLGSLGVRTGELAVLERKINFIKEGSIEATEEELTQMEFRRDLLKGQVDILNSLLPVEKSQVEIEKEKAGTLEETNKELKENIKLQKERKAFNDRDKEKAQTIPSVGTPTSVGTTTGLNPVALNDMVNNQIANNNATARELELEAIQNEEDAKLAIREAGANAAVQLLSDIFGAAQDERLAEINSDAEAQKAILQQRLDDGVISEEQFATQVADIEKKQRIASAKADKKKAIFDIGIAAIVASIKALPNLIASAAILGVGLIQAGVVAAKPIPKFAGGVETLDGPGTKTSDSIPAMLSKGERVVPANINDQLNGISNQDLPSLVNGAMLVDRNIKSNRQDNNMLLASLLVNGNNINKQVLTALLNGVSSYDRDGVRYILDAKGGIEKFNV